MPPATDNGKTSWTVESQTSGVGKDSRGQITDGYTIKFTTGLGNQGEVFVPRKDYSPPAVIDAIRAHATELDQVSRSGA